MIYERFMSLVIIYISLQDQFFEKTCEDNMVTRCATLINLNCLWNRFLNTYNFNCGHNIRILPEHDTADLQRFKIVHHTQAFVMIGGSRL